MENQDPDLPLMLELQRGNDSALDLLMERFQGPLYQFIYRYILNESDAAELLQEVFVRLYFKKDQYRPMVSVSAWLYRIALNLCWDHVRSKAHRQREKTESITLHQPDIIENQERDLVSMSLDPAQKAMSNETMAELEHQIHLLPHDLKTAFILMVMEQRSQKECADLLETTPKAIETRVYRARKILEKNLSILQKTALK